MGPRTETEYRRALLHYFGGEAPPFRLQTEFGAISSSRMTVLKAALARACRIHGHTDAEIDQVLAQIPGLPWAPKRGVDIPAQLEAMAIEREIERLPMGRRAAIGLILKTGLRAEELLRLPRAAVARAYEHGELKMMRKGGFEQTLPAKHAVGVFEELLSAPAAKFIARGPVRRQLEGLRRAGLHGRTATELGRLEQGRTLEWATVGEIFSGGAFPSQYHALRTAVRRIGKAAGVEGMRPHKLRHIFASRMSARGAPIPEIQWYLGHKNLTTTMLYVHGGQNAFKYLE